MAKDDRPKSGPIGGKNRDRSIPPGGRPNKNESSGSGGGDSQTNRTKDDPDTDGYSVGGRGR
jgi:hypothetical protein